MFPTTGSKALACPCFKKRGFRLLEYVQSEGAQFVAPGVFELTGVPAGKYSVRLREPKSGQLQQSSEMDLVKDGQELDTSRSEPGARVKLSVKMPRQDPSRSSSTCAAGFAAAKRGLQACPDAAGETTSRTFLQASTQSASFLPPKPYSVVRASSEGVESPDTTST